MQLKKMVQLVLSCVLAGALFTGCGGDKGDNRSSDDKVKLGMISQMNATETQMGGIYNKLIEEAGMKMPKHQPKFYESLTLMQMGIESEDVSEISVYQCVADYIIATNDKFEIVPNEAINKLIDSFCFAVRKEDTALKSDLDKVIGEMKQDGTLDNLITEYITHVSKGQNPPSVEIPVIEGADKIKVGVTGDLPPLDLVLSDGTPAGFNTAMLAEIAKRLDKNIEIVQIDSGARAIALTSKMIDVVFWAIIPFGNSDIPSDIDKPEGLELSTPYFKDNIAHIRFKSNK